MPLASRLLKANPSIQVSSVLSGLLTTPSAKQAGANSAFQKIANVNVSINSATVSFTSIPSTYSMLELRWVALDSATGASNYIQSELTINSDTNNNYRRHYIFSQGTTKTATSGTLTNHIAIAATSGYTDRAPAMGSGVIYILDYASTSKNKVVLSKSGYVPESETATNNLFIWQSAVWTSNSAITSLTFTTNGTAFTSPTQFSLYGWL